MMTKNLYFLAFLLIGIFLIPGCKDDKEEEGPVVNKPTVSIGYPAEITTTSFTVEVEVSSDGGGTVTERGLCYSAAANPTLDDEVLSSGTGEGTFTLTVSDLPSNTLYYIKGFATNEEGTSYSVAEFTVVTSLGTVTDFEGNVYGTVQIGNQVWTRENLKSKKYTDGTAIPGVWAPDNNELNVELYGRLYDWYSVMHGEASSDANPSPVQGVCPSGFHVPSDAEWKELEMQLGMSQEEADLEGYRGSVAGKLKEKQLWMPSPNLSDNSTGFSAKPSGYRNLDGTYEFGFFWGAFYNATESLDTSTTAARLLTGDDNGIWRYSDSKKYAMSVRCIKDE